MVSASLFYWFFYSLEVNPVLQYSVLIFSFPFLFFILFGHIGELSSKSKTIGLIILTPILLLSLIFGREYYTLFYQSPYEGIVDQTQEFQEENSNKAISIIDSNDKFTNYYVNKKEEKFPYHIIQDFSSRKELVSFLDTIKDSNLSYGSLSLSDALLPAIFIDYFPALKSKVVYSQGNYYEFSKEGTSNVKLYRDAVWENDFNGWTDKWSVKKESVGKMASSQNGHVFSFFEGQEWGLSFEIELDELVLEQNDLIDIRLDVTSVNDVDELIIVSEIIDEDVKYHWKSTSNHEYRGVKDSSSYRMYHTIKLSDNTLGNNKKILKVYCWNKGKTPIIVDDVSIKVRIGNPIIYGLLREIQKN